MLIIADSADRVRSFYGVAKMPNGYGDRLRAGRIQQGLTQQQLATNTGVNVATIRDLEQGRSSTPRGRTQAALASLVGPAPSDEAPVARVEILGRLRVWRAALPADIGHGSHRVVLARLALTPGEAVHRDELVNLLWAARPPASAVNMVQAYIGRVRRLLGAGDGSAGPVTVGLSGAGYELDMPAEAHDAGRFTRLTESGWTGRP
jgi:transcriptional regulator with XRE-family HTH domain